MAVASVARPFGQTAFAPVAVALFTTHTARLVALLVQVARRVVHRVLVRRLTEQTQPTEPMATPTRLLAMFAGTQVVAVAPAGVELFLVGLAPTVRLAHRAELRLRQQQSQTLVRVVALVAMAVATVRPVHLAR